MMSLSDLELLKLIKNPETRDKGYRCLIEMYQRRVYGMIRKMVIVHEDADDITQQTFIKAFKNMNKFQSNSSIFTWLYRIAVNESLNFLEKKKRRFFTNLDDHTEILKKHVDTSPLIDGDEINRRLQKAILGLPEKQRLVFNLRYFEEMPYEDMSLITDTSVGALKASYHHAVKKIESALQTE